MLRASLKPIGGEALLTNVGIDPASRPQGLDIEAFCVLARAIEERAYPPSDCSPLQRLSGRSAGHGAGLRQRELTAIDSPFEIIIDDNMVIFQ